MSQIRKIAAELFVLIAGVFVLSGCFPTGEKQQTESSAGLYKSGEKFEYSKDKLTAEFTIPEKLPQATRIGIKTKTVDREEVIKLFFGDRAYTQGPEDQGMLDIYNTDDGAFHLNFLGGGIRFYDETVCTFEYPVHYGSLVNYCVPREWDYNAPSDDKLEDFPRETALNRAEELFKKLGIGNLGEPDIYPMSVDAIKRVVEEEDTYYDIQKLSQEHECYVLRYPQFFDGIEVSDLPAAIGSTWYNDSKITLVLTREEIVFFTAEILLESDFEVLSREPVKYDLVYALDEFQRFHNAAYLDGETLIYDFKPVYYPDRFNESGALEFIPMWEFDGRSRRQEDGYINRKRYVAAVTSDSGILKTYKE